MQRLKFLDGDLVRNIRTGELRQIVGEEYTKRFMNAADFEMEAFGHGDLAGTYAGCVQTIVLNGNAGEARGLIGKQGMQYGVRASLIRDHWVNLTAAEEAV